MCVPCPCARLIPSLTGLLGYFTVQLAHELLDTTIKVNSAKPVCTATDLNGFVGPRAGHSWSYP